MDCNAVSTGEELNKHSCFRSVPIVCMFHVLHVHLVIMYSLCDNKICLN